MGANSRVPARAVAPVGEGNDPRVGSKRATGIRRKRAPVGVPIPVSNRVQARERAPTSAGNRGSRPGPGSSSGPVLGRNRASSRRGRENNSHHNSRGSMDRASSSSSSHVSTDKGSSNRGLTDRGSDRGLVVVTSVRAVTRSAGRVPGGPCRHLHRWRKNSSRFPRRV